jgi:cyclic pyranopterin phosphate synthase
MSDEPRPDRLTHLDARGRASMVDVGDKPVTHRVATARAVVYMEPGTLAAILGGEVQKGEVLQIARVAGIMAAKKTGDLIPLCHPIGVDRVAVGFAALDDPACLVVEATATVRAKTGVEMEAMVAVTTAALTVYDMCKARDRGMRVEHVHLARKSGGRSGDFAHPDPPGPVVPDEAEWR